MKYTDALNDKLIKKYKNSNNVMSIGCFFDSNIDVLFDNQLICKPHYCHCQCLFSCSVKNSNTEELENI